MVNLKLLIEKEIIELWSEYSNYYFTNIPPLAPDKLNCKNSILFIGLNPSISKKEVIRLHQNSIKDFEFYPNQKGNMEIHKYFNKFIDISKKTGLEWEHLDLLYLRETKQNKIHEILKTNEGIDFIYKQLKASEKIIEHIIKFEKPKMFVVNNTLSRLFLGKDKNDWLGFDFKWVKELGTYTYKNIPFFFTSMLTGQRALDIGSYERLIWHINYIKDK